MSRAVFLLSSVPLCTLAFFFFFFSKLVEEYKASMEASVSPPQGAALLAQAGLISEKVPASQIPRAGH